MMRGKLKMKKKLFGESITFSWKSFGWFSFCFGRGFLPFSGEEVLFTEWQQPVNPGAIRLKSWDLQSASVGKKVSSRTRKAVSQNCHSLLRKQMIPLFDFIVRRDSCLQLVTANSLAQLQQGQALLLVVTLNWAEMIASFTSSCFLTSLGSQQIVTHGFVEYPVLWGLIGVQAAGRGSIAGVAIELLYGRVFENLERVNSPVDGKKSWIIRLHDTPVKLERKPSAGRVMLTEAKKWKAPVFELTKLKVDSKKQSYQGIIPFKWEAGADDLPQGQTGD